MKYFVPSEFSHFEKMDPTLLSMLDAMREAAGIPIRITSSYRTDEENKAVGGVKYSAHTKGLAVDIACPSNAERLKYVSAALSVGFRRIGISKYFIHVDIDGDKPDCIWLY